MVSACFLTGTIIATAQTKTRVKFPAGTHGTTVSGTIRGYAYRDYKVGAKEGQTMSVTLDSEAIATVFTIRAPDGSDLETGVEASEFNGDLPMSGDYVIRVLMMRYEARRKGSFSKYKLKISVK